MKRTRTSTKKKELSYEERQRILRRERRFAKTTIKGGNKVIVGDLDEDLGESTPEIIRTKTLVKIKNSTAFGPKTIRQAYKLALLGFTNGKIAKFLEVSENTLWKWRKLSPEFREALEKGRSYADAKVAKAMYRRAVGYKYKDTHISVLKDGTVIRTPVVKTMHPDVTAGFKWLEKRQKELWANVSHEAGEGSQKAIDAQEKMMSKFSKEQLEFMKNIGLAARAIPENTKNN